MMRVPAAAALVIAALCAPAALAQPVRDTARTAPSGSATIAGVVVSDEATPRPLRRVRVMLNEPVLPVGRTIVTQDDGSFVFDRLPAGRYTIGAVKDGYVTTNHGAARSGRPGTPVAVGDGEAQRIAVRLPRGAVITGTVTTADGQPVPGVTVSALLDRYVPAIGERRLTAGALSPSQTDDRGVYRIYGLPPGDYLISVSARAMPPVIGELFVQTDADIKRAMSGDFSPPRRGVVIAPTFYPGTPTVSQATVVTVGKGEERTGIDIQLQYAPTARIEGVVYSSRPGAAVNVGLVAPPIPMSTAMDFRSQRRVDADGRFSIAGVPPGRYTLTASSWIPPAGPGESPTMFWASTDVMVDGEDVSNIALTLSTGIKLAGRVVFDGARPPDVDLTKLRLNVPIALTGQGIPVPVPPLRIDGEGRFAIEGLAAGTYKFGNVQGLRAPLGKWWLRSIAIDGREVLDGLLELRQATDDVVVTFADRASSLSGIARHAAGTPSADAWVVVFGTDRSTWFFNSRRVAAVKADREGGYTIRNLPAGEYLAIATTDLEQGEWFDPMVLQQLAPAAMRVALGEYEQKTVDVVLR